MKEANLKKAPTCCMISIIWCFRKGKDYGAIQSFNGCRNGDSGDKHKESFTTVKILCETVMVGINNALLQMCQNLKCTTPRVRPRVNWGLGGLWCIQCRHKRTVLISDADREEPMNVVRQAYRNLWTLHCKSLNCPKEIKSIFKKYTVQHHLCLLQ